MKDTILATLIILLLVVNLVFLFILSPGGRTSGPSPEQIGKYAAALESNQLYEQAAEQYQHYLQEANLPPEQRANILYSIGRIYLENLQDYENALAAFLQVSTLYPGATIAREAEKKMIPCYEGLKRSFDAQSKLKKLTDLKPEDEPRGTGPVVARIGEREITMDQLNQEIAKLPPSVQAQFNSPQKKLELLHNKIFLELLHDMALRKEYDKDRQIRLQIRDMEKNMLASRILQEEVADKVQITNMDIELYYKAHSEEFSQPEAKQIAHIQVDSPEKAQEVYMALQAGMDFNEAIQQFSQDESTSSREGLLGFVMKERSSIPGIGNAPQLVERIMQMQEQEISDPLKGPEGYHIFKVIKQNPAQVYALEQVRPQVEERVRALREKELQQALMERLLKSDRVNINEQVLKANAGRAISEPAVNE